MINHEEFERKVKSMSAHDIIMSMVNGLRKPKTKIDMNTYGAIREGICFGCAATNAVLHIMDANEEGVKSHVAYTEYDGSPVRGFERAINQLRMGEVDIYNEWAMPMSSLRLPPYRGKNYRN